MAERLNRGVSIPIVIIIIVVLAILLVGGIFAYQYFANKTQPAQTQEDITQEDITRGDVTRPGALGVDELGKWTINKLGSNLVYGVDWESAGYNVGDYKNGMLPNSQKNNVFTHSYSKAGIYTVQFFAKNIETNALVPIVDSTVKIRVGVPDEPIVTSIKPAHGIVGAVVIVSGNNFTRSGNTVYLSKEGAMGATAHVSNLESIDGKTIKFAVPAMLFRPSEDKNATEIPADSGIYDLSVSNVNGSSYNKGHLILFTIDEP